MKSLKVKKGELCFFEDTKTSFRVDKFKDNNDVILLRTFDNFTKNTKGKPSAIANYNTYAKRVDKVNQVCQY